MNCDEYPDKMEVAQKQEFEPYAAVDVATRLISVVVKDTLGCPSDTLIRIRNPEGICFVAKKLGHCDGNPALDAVLDELEEWATSFGERNVIPVWRIKIEIASLRKSPPEDSGNPALDELEKLMDNIEEIADRVGQQSIVHTQTVKAKIASLRKFHPSKSEAFIRKDEREKVCEKILGWFRDDGRWSYEAYSMMGKFIKTLKGGDGK